MGTSVEKISRRKAVKSIAGGVAALAAYQTLPTTWNRPIVEQIFLPAHAATSGVTITNLQVAIVNGDTSTSSVDVRITGSVVPPTAGATVNLTITPTP